MKTKLIADRDPGSGIRDSKEIRCPNPEIGRQGEDRFVLGGNRSPGFFRISTSVLAGALVMGGLVSVVWLGLAANPEPRTKPKLAISIKPQHVADALRAVVSAEREVYTQVVVHRLQDEEKVIKASARWQEDKALPTPCQMFRLNSEAFASKGVELSYVLRSLQPISQRNAPETEAEKKGLEFVAKHPEQAFYGEELLGGRWYFTAVYPDVAFNPSCVSCHNAQKDSPKHDYQVGDVMGGVVVRVALEL